MVTIMNLKKGRFLETIACMEKIAASVLLKLFINGNERWHATDSLTCLKDYECHLLCFTLYLCVVETNGKA